MSTNYAILGDLDQDPEESERYGELTPAASIFHDGRPSVYIDGR